MLEDDLDMMGADDEDKALILDYISGVTEEDFFPLLPENVDAFAIFARCSTQWRLSPNGFAMGIDYTSLQSVISMTVKDPSSELFEEIQLIEKGALSQMSDNRAKQGD